jgi:hypothetical protein
MATNPAPIKASVKSPLSRAFKKAYIKRRLGSTGLFESDWQEITDDVKKWGKITFSTNPQRPSKFKFNNFKLVVANDEGKYNPEDDESSLWFTYANQQRTLVKIETGFLNQTLSADGIWYHDEVPGEDKWDVDFWDSDAFWDNDGISFHGLLQGDLILSDKNEIALGIKPLTQIFLDYPARNLVGLTSTGVTASQFMTLLRDQTDGAGAFIFRPFFGDTTSNWNIETTTNVYSDLNTSTAKDVRDKNVWQVIEKLAEAENFFPYVGQNGIFNFTSKTQSTTTAWSFFGKGSNDTEFGNTIKSIDRYGKKMTSFFSRVEVKFREEDTSTSYVVKESTLTVDPSNGPWNFGYRTFQMENVWIPTSTVAETIAQSLFDDFASLKSEIKFSTSFVPHLNILDKIDVTYDSTQPNPDSHWDINNWATASSNELVWDLSKGDAIKLVGKEFKLLSIDIDLDNFQNRFTAREL